MLVVRITRDRKHREVWESLGRADPDWAVLTDPSRRGGGWTDDLDAFYASGRTEVAAVLETLPDDAGRERATDWGSGTGRLTFALAAEYDRVTGVDVSDSMLAALAERAAGRGVGNVDGVRVDAVEPGGDQDLVLSLLVLQHLSDEAAVVEALATMVGCLRVGGRLVVEVPDTTLTWRARLQPRFRAYQALRRLGAGPERLHRRGLSGISMVTVAQAEVARALAAAGAEVEHVVAAPDGGFRYVRYRARRVR